MQQKWIAQRRMGRRWAVVWLVAGLVAGWRGPVAAAETVNLIANGEFKQDGTGWEGVGADADKAVTITPLADGAAGAKAAVLKRITKDAAVALTWQGLKFKPQTLYKLSITGFGKDGAAVGLRPQSSKDDTFFNLCKSWATSSAPIAKSDKPFTTEFTFDSGLKADRAFLAIRLPDGEATEYTVTAVKMEELQSSAPDAKELVIGHIGDSFTATSYLPFEERVDRLLQSLLEAKFKNRKIRNVNLGVDGEFIQELTETGRYEKAIHQQFAHFDIVIIRYGANDKRKYTPEEFSKKLGALCDQIEKDYPGVKIVIGAGLFLKGGGTLNTKDYGPYWQASRDLAAARKYPLADLYAAFEKADADDLTRSPSDMHPSAKGVKIVADTEFAALDALMAAAK